MTPVCPIFFTLCLSFAFASARRPLFNDISARDEWLEDLYLRDLDVELDPRDAWLEELDTRGMFQDDLYIRQVNMGQKGGNSPALPSALQAQGSDGAGQKQYTDYPGQCEKQKGGENRCSCKPPEASNRADLRVLGDLCPSEGQGCNCKVREHSSYFLLGL